MESESAELALVCGDISDFGDAVDVQVVLDAFFGEIPGFYVTGNCDPQELLTKGVMGFEDRNLHAKAKLVGTTMFVGLGGSTPTPGPTPTQLREDEILTIMLKLAREVESEQRKSLVFLFHNPLYNTTTDLSSSRSHAGSRILRDFVLRLKPQIFFHGHIHEARGVDKIEENYIVNPVPAFHGYYALATLDDRHTTVELKEA